MHAYAYKVCKPVIYFAKDYECIENQKFFQFPQNLVLIFKFIVLDLKSVKLLWSFVFPLKKKKREGSIPLCCRATKVWSPPITASQILHCHYLSISKNQW